MSAPDRSASSLPAWPERPQLSYTIGTLVTDTGVYDSMRRSFVAGGFGETDCEYLAIDNTGLHKSGASQTSAYAGLNRVLAAARGRYVILCHQDVELLADGRAALDRRLDELEAHDPAWGVAGNAGGVKPGLLALRITDPHGADTRVGRFPARVRSLDENFLVVKRGAGLGFSRDLDGFHLYGADICLVAATLGASAYVIDFHLRHLSAGNSRTGDFARALAAFQAKWSRALAPRWVQTTCALLVLSGSAWGRGWRRAVAAHVAKLNRWRDKRGP